MTKPHGVYVAMLTPFDSQGFINENEVRRMVDFQIAAGVHGLFPVSSAGEFIHLGREEKIRLMEIVVDQAHGRVAVTPGVGSSHPAEAVALAQRAKDIGCQGVVAAAPYYYPLSQEMVEKYYLEIAEAVEIPLILYNIPLFSTPLGYDLVERLCSHPNIVAMKDSSGSMVDFAHFVDTSRRTGEDLHVLTGREETLLACLTMGGRGCMTATAGILPEVMVDIYTAWQRGDVELARKRQFSILPLVRAMFSLPFPLGFKVAMQARGFDMGPPKQSLPDDRQMDHRAKSEKIGKLMASMVGTQDDP